MSEKLSSSIGMNAEDFKTGVAQLNRELRGVKSEFSATAATFVDWTKDIDGLEARTKSLNSQIEIQGQKVAATRAEYERMAAAHGEDSRAAQEALIKYNNETATLNKMNTELGSTEKAMDELKNSSNETGGAVQESGNKFEGFKRVIGGVGTTIKASIGIMIGLVAMLATVGAAVGGLVFSTAQAADELNTMSQQTGISTQRLQEMKFAGEILGTSLETMTGSQAKLVKSMAAARDGTGAQAESFKRLGISVTNAQGNLRDTQAVFGEAIDALGKISNPAERDAAAMDLFGKSAQELNPLIKAGSAEFANMAKQAHEVGAVIDDETVQAAASFQDQVDGLKLGLQGIGGTIAGAFLPQFSGIAGQATGYLKDLAGVVKQYSVSIPDTFDERTHQLIKGRSGPDLAGMAKGIAEIFTNIAKDVAAQAPQMLESGLGIVKSVLQAIIGALPSLLPAAVGIITSLIDFIVASLPSLISAGLQIVLALVNAILPALPKVIDAALGIIISLATGLTDALPVLLPTVANVIVQIISTLVKNLPMLIKAALLLLTALAQGLTVAMPILLKALPVIVKALVDGLLENRVLLTTAAGELIGALLAGILALADSGGEAMVELGKVMIDSLKKAYDPEALAEAGTGLMQGFGSAIQAEWKKFSDKYQKMLQKDWKDVTTGWNKHFGDVSKDFKKSWDDNLAGLGRFLSDMLTQIESNVSGLRNAGINLITNFWSGIAVRWDTLKTDLRQFVSDLPGVIDSIASRLSDAGRNMIGSVWNGISARWGILKTDFGKFTAALPDIVWDITQAMFEAGRGIIGYIWTGIQGRWTKLLADFQALLTNLPDWIKAILGLPTGNQQDQSFGQSLAAGFGDSLLDEVRRVQRQMQVSVGGFGAGAGLAGAGTGGNISSTDQSFKLQANVVNFHGPQTPGTVAANVRQKRKRY